MDFLIKMQASQASKCFSYTEIIAKAESALKITPPHITDNQAPLSQGGPHDFYSSADYFWPNPSTADNLPYIRKDGETNPGNFVAHRHSMRIMRTCTAHLAAAYHITGNEGYAVAAVRFLKEFFLDDATKMNPHLLYAQAIPGICHGRGIGIIDTLHLADVPVAVSLLNDSPAMTNDIFIGLKEWFAAYLNWITTHPQGIDEMNTNNNHSVCWSVQAATFAKFTGNQEVINLICKLYKEVYLPDQMAADGSFPREIDRTKPYMYSCFIVDNMANLCHILSAKDDNLWEYELADGRGIKKAMDYVTPFIADISKWTYPKDVQYFEEMPPAMPFLLLAGAAYGRDDYIELWAKLSKKPQGDELRRNIAIRQPYNWMV